jgi:predicted amidohydrolase YtcJ
MPTCSVTAHTAWQIKEEKTKSTLEVGKLTVLVILKRNGTRHAAAAGACQRLATQCRIGTG